MKGIIPVLETPFGVDGAVDMESFDRLVDYIVGLGLEGVVFPAFASEFYKLSDEERRFLIERLNRRVVSSGSDMIVVGGVAESATFRAQEVALGAIEAGCGMINLITPSSVRVGSVALRAHLGAVLRAIAPVPAVVQYSPELATRALTIEDILWLSREYENLIGVKVEAVPPGPTVTRLRESEPRLSCYVGYGGIAMIDALRRGAAGIQPGSSLVEVYQEILRLWHGGDERDAIALHGRLVSFVGYWMQDVELIIKAEKVISMKRGIISTDTCRDPCWELSGFEREMIDRCMDEFGRYISGQV